MSAAEVPNATCPHSVRSELCPPCLAGNSEQNIDLTTRLGANQRDPIAPE